MERIVREPRLFDEFEQVYAPWRRVEVTQGQAADLLGRSVRTFRRWVPNGTWDLVVTFDEATSRVYSGFFVDEHTIWAGFRGVRETVLCKGLFGRIGATWAPDCGSSPRPTQFGRAMTELGIEVVPAFPKWAHRNRNRTLAVMRNCPPQQLRRARIGERRWANRFLSRYWPRFNEAFSAPAEGDRFESLLPGMRAALDGAFCLKERLDVDVAV